MPDSPPILAPLLLLMLALAVGACGGAEPIASPVAGAEPTKADLVATLRGLQSSLDAEDYASAKERLVDFPGMTAEQMQAALAGFVEKREISSAGIDILEARGRFGPLLEVFPEDGEHFARKAGVDPAECYALSLGDAQVAAQWDGRSFRLIRLDDVGKLE